MEKLLVGTIFYLTTPEPIHEELYEPVSFEQWKLLRELEPSKFFLPYDKYVESKKEAYEELLIQNRNVSYSLRSYMYNISTDEMKMICKKNLNKIIGNPDFIKFLNKEDEDIVNDILR